MTTLVKRRGHEEKFDERKVYASCYAACVSAHYPEKDAEKVAGRVCRAVKAELRGKKKVRSEEIFRHVVRVMKKHDRKAAFMYETHLDVS